MRLIELLVLMGIVGIAILAVCMMFFGWGQNPSLELPEIDEIPKVKYEIYEGKG